MNEVEREAEYQKAVDILAKYIKREIVDDGGRGNNVVIENEMIDLIAVDIREKLS